MRKRRFVPFWNLLFYSVISAVLISISIYIVINVKSDKDWNEIHWGYTLLAAFCIAIVFCYPFLMPRINIDLNCNKIEIFYLVNWKKNSLDCDSNWCFYPDQIENVSVVKLTNDEKIKYTSSRFLFHKYLKIELKYGYIKYVYISPYSNKQINLIIKMLTQSKNLNRFRH